MADDVRKAVGNRIRVLRKERKLTQERLADRAKVNPKFLGAVERGEKNLTLETLGKIADGLRVTVEELFPLPHTGNSPLVAEIAEALRKADQETLETVLQIVRLLDNRNRRRTRRRI